jgi:hypothetical protein
MSTRPVIKLASRRVSLLGRQFVTAVTAGGRGGGGV